MSYTIKTKWPSDGVPDIYFSHKYMRLYEEKDTSAILFQYDEAGEKFFFPFMSSKIAKIGSNEIDKFSDFASVYGYGGPWSTSFDSDFLREAVATLTAYCNERNIVAGFVRLHPLMANERLLPGFDIIYSRDTVCVDLLDSDPWMNQISSKNRNMIRKAEKTGLEFEVDYHLSRIRDFHRLYNSTMKRIGAESFYYFNDQYFKKLGVNLKGHAFLSNVLKEGIVICSAIIMTWGNWAHYHLAGSDSLYHHMAPNNFLLFKTIEFLKKNNYVNFHLGGGTTSKKEDPLFRFKKSFSNNLIPFYFGKKIFSNEDYHHLKEIWKKQFPEKEKMFGSSVLCYRY